MPDYSKGKIYKIQNQVDDDIYVGSTTEPLNVRLNKHRYKSKIDSTNICKKMVEIGCEKFFIELIEEYPCKSQFELVAREGYWIREIGTINNYIAGRDLKQYNIDNKESLCVKHKEYYEDNKDVILAKNKEHRDKNKISISETRNKLCMCECGHEYTHCNKTRHLRSNLHNERMTQETKSILCECGGKYVINMKSRHIKLKIHQNFINKTHMSET